MMEFEALENEIRSGNDISVPEKLDEWLIRTKENFVAGTWRAGTADLFETVNPATGKSLAKISAAGADDIGEAVRSARKVFESGEWSGLPTSERAKVLREIAKRLKEHRAPLAILETLDTGKPIAESFEGDIARAATNFEFFADLALQDGGQAFPQNEVFHFSMREPLGVVALITPWNLPLYLETWKIAPCLLMGNSAILKPSEWTPLTATYFTELIADLVPKGIFQLVHGFGEKAAGEFLTSHPDVDAISFTGETVTGKAIMKVASDSLTRVSFELGGKGASIVFEDADIDAAVNETLRAAFRNQGQICLACPRIFVHKKVQTEFTDKFVAAAKEIQPGNPLNYKTRMGSLVGEEHFNKVQGYLKQISAPIKVECGGERAYDVGCFIHPTVLTGVPLDHPISQDEIFGPVVSIHPFETEEEVLDAVNGSRYGLSSSVWTQNLDRGYRMARNIRTGLVWVNCWFVRDLRVPFGGQKASGVGREGGEHSLEFFSEWKSVCVKVKS